VFLLIRAGMFDGYVGCNASDGLSTLARPAWRVWDASSGVSALRSPSLDVPRRTRRSV
jgi:hypothetical protein